MASLSYVALITSKDSQGITLAICEGTMLIGVLLGNLINGPIVDATSLSTLAYINAALTLLPVLIVSVFLTDVLPSRGVQRSWKDILGVPHLLDAVKCVFKKRQGHNRLKIHICLAALLCLFMAAHGFTNVSFLYFVKQRQMSMTEYSIFTGMLSALKSIVGPGALTLLKKGFSLDERDIGMFSLAAGTLGYTVMSIDSIPYSAWIGGILLCPEIIFFGIIYSFQIDSCDDDEFGQLFAYNGITKFLLGTVGLAAYQSLYSATLLVWPAAFLAVSAMLSIISMIMFTFWIHYANK